MYGTVFLGSQFTRMILLRAKIYELIEEKKTLKCVSFQKDQNRVFWRAMIPEIAEEISRTSHFIFLVGPDEGTTLRQLCERENVLLGPYERYQELPFTHFEAELVKQRLDKLYGEESCDKRAFINKRVLVFDIEPEDYRPPETVRKLLRFFSEWGIESHTLRTRLSNSKRVGVRGGRSKAKIVSMKVPKPSVGADTAQWDVRSSLDDDHFRHRIDDFLRSIEGDSVSRTNSFLRDNVIDPKQHIHLLGWTGLENWDRYGPYLQSQEMRDDNFSFLTMNRSIITLPSDIGYFPRIRHSKLGFDFVLADAEVIPHYLKTEAVSTFVPDIEADISRRLSPQGRRPIDRFAPVVEKLMKGLLDRCFAEHPTRRICFAPLMYGFNEILINNKGPRQGGFEGTSYADFDLATLVRGGYRVGLWSWWVSTLPIILFARLRYLVETGNLESLCEPEHKHFAARWKRIEDVETFSTYVNDDRHRPVEEAQADRFITLLVDSIIADLDGMNGFSPRNPGGTIETFASFEDQSRCARGENAVDLVIGSSSATLPPMFQNEAGYDWRLAIPIEGVFVWMNCVCGYPNTETGRHHAKLVKYWLDSDFQGGLVDVSSFDPKGYVGLPVVDIESKKLVQSDTDLSAGVSAIVSTLKNAEGGTLKYALRPFPVSLWPLMEYQWTRIQGAISRHRTGAEVQAA